MWWVIGLAAYLFLFALGLLFLRGSSLAESYLRREPGDRELSGGRLPAGDESAKRQREAVQPDRVRQAAG